MKTLVSKFNDSWLVVYVCVGVCGCKFCEGEKMSKILHRTIISKAPRQFAFVITLENICSIFYRKFHRWRVKRTVTVVQLTAGGNRFIELRIGRESWRCKIATK